MARPPFRQGGIAASVRSRARRSSFRSAARSLGAFPVAREDISILDLERLLIDNAVMKNNRRMEVEAVDTHEYEPNGFVTKPSWAVNMFFRETKRDGKRNGLNSHICFPTAASGDYKPTSTLIPGGFQEGTRRFTFVQKVISMI